MKKISYYLCLFLLSALTAFGQKKSDAKITQTIATYEARISEALSASEHYEMLDNYKKIIKLYEKHDLNKLKLAAYYTQAGQVAYTLKEYKKALKYQQKALAIQEKKLATTDLVVPYRNMVKTCIALKLYLKAVKYQEQIIQVLKDEPDIEHADLAMAYGEIAAIYEASRKYQLALGYYEDATIILHGNEQYKKEFAYYQESVDFLKKKLEERPQGYASTDPTSSKVVYDEGAVVSELSVAFSILHLEKNYAEALSRFTELNEELETGKNWESIGLCHYYLGNYPEAIEAYQTSIALSPELMQENYHNNIGVAYAKNGQFDKAKIAFEMYQSLLSDDYWHHRNWGLWYALQNKTYEAIQALKIAVESGFDDVEWLENDSSLDSIRNDEDFEYLLRIARENLKK